MHKIQMIVPPLANWWQTIFAQTQSDAPKFRVYVRAADEKWYKQQRPFWFAEKKYYVFCALGCVNPAAKTYSMVALDATTPLPNILTELPEEKVISAIEEVTRV